MTFRVFEDIDWVEWPDLYATLWKEFYVVLVGTVVFSALMNLSVVRLHQLKSFGLIALILNCGVAIAFLQQSRLQTLQSKGALTAETVAQQVKAEQTSLEILQRTPAFGFDNLVGDWAFLRFLQYFGDTDARSLNDYRLSSDFFEIIVERDPWFTESYFYLSGSSSLFAGTPERTVSLLDQGLAAMTPLEPDGSHFLWRMKAIDEHLFLGDVDSAIHSYLTAAKWAGYHDDQRSLEAMWRSQDSAAFLIQDPRSLQAQVTAWTTLLGNARDQVTYQIVVEKLAKLGVELRVNDDGSATYSIPEAVWQAERDRLNISENPNEQQ